MADEYRDLTREQQEVLADFFRAMPPTRVDRVMAWGNGRCAAAIRRGDMGCIRKPDSKRVTVTPAQIADYVRDYLTVRPAKKEMAS